MLLTPLVLCLAAAPQTPVAAAPSRTWDEFPVFVWREKYAGKPLPKELSEPFGGVVLMRGEDSDWAREQGLDYLVWNVAGRDALHLDADEAWSARVEDWIRTQDETLLVREPCLSDPKTVAQLTRTLDETLAKHGPHPGLGFVLGDEVSLTPNGDPFDLCRSEFCEAKWKEYARHTGLPERAPLTDEVRRGTLEDDYSLLPAWLARRRFHHEELVRLLEFLAERARGDGERRVALLGLKGRTAFGGIDVRSAGGLANLIEGYPLGDTTAHIETLKCAGRTEQVRRKHQPKPYWFDGTLDTVFLGHETPQGAAWLAWLSWLREADGLVLWSDADLSASESVRDRLGEAVRRIRNLVPRFGGRERQHRRMLRIVSDADSIAASWLLDASLDGPTWPRRKQSYQEEHGSRERKLHGWRLLAEDLGYPLEAARLEDLRDNGSPGVVLLVRQLVLAQEDVEILRGVLDRGGTLIVDGRFGWVDRNGSPWEESAFELLRRHAPERVLRAPEKTEDIKGLARDAKRHYLEFLGSALAVGPPPFRLNGQCAKVEWLEALWFADRVSNCLEDRPILPGLVALLPKTRTSEERAALTDLRLEIESPYAIRWIHPPEGNVLPAGDAAIFLLLGHPDLGDQEER